MRNNGGDVLCDGDVWQLHPVWDDTDHRTIARTTSHIVHETLEARTWTGFPMEAVAIASDGNGNLLVLRRGSAPVDIDWT